MDTIRIQLTFTEQTPHGEYTDALYFTEDEWQKIKPEDISAKKKERVDKWIEFLNTPIPEKTPEQNEADLEGLRRLEAMLEEQRNQLTQ